MNKGGDCGRIGTLFTVTFISEKFVTFLTGETCFSTFFLIEVSSSESAESFGLPVAISSFVKPIELSCLRRF